ncbi:hypothetical protein BJ973_002560 [Actinoplanes tereljensis]|uniref:Uncharacterized protein n=1 Tax=Paractinoplanes tereljensis TaxID=571912 RepID=A0A919TTZ8_9ACTN|nr:hypothetical protein [Actinoplanes tereljensis]GIF22236.1 hypothetical protein Ate02nite_49660 [Actinoplanes tereljensis]
MTDHHDFADHFGDDHHDDPLPFDDDHQLPDDHVTWEDHHVEIPEHEDLPFDDHVAHVVDDHVVVEEAPVADIPDLPEVELSDSVFPPAVDVGELPEPVDGFPWIDTGSLGLADIQAALHEADTTDPVQPAELAEYAGTDLPPGADPWATLAESDDPATAALAKWWSQQN